MPMPAPIVELAVVLPVCCRRRMCRDRAGKCLVDRCPMESHAPNPFARPVVDPCRGTAGNTGGAVDRAVAVVAAAAVARSVAGVAPAAALAFAGGAADTDGCGTVGQPGAATGGSAAPPTDDRGHAGRWFLAACCPGTAASGGYGI